MQRQFVREGQQELHNKPIQHGLADYQAQEVIRQIQNGNVVEVMVLESKSWQVTLPGGITQDIRVIITEHGGLSVESP